MSVRLQYPTMDPSTARNVTDVHSLDRHGYLIGDRIGRGAFASVNNAIYRDPINKQSVRLACKIIDKAKALPEILAKFTQREIDILMEIDHPHIIKVHSIIARLQIIYVFMENACNGDLMDYVRVHGPQDENQSKLWFSQLCDAIAYLHSRDIAHRDIKLENILLSKKMHVKLSDFGFAKYCPNWCVNFIDLSQTYCGTAAYAAPEIILHQPYDAKMADVWSLGVVLFIMLNASMPFDNCSLANLVHDQQQRRFHFKNGVWLALTHQCKQLLLTTLEFEVNKRITLNDILRSSWFKLPCK